MLREGVDRSQYTTEKKQKRFCIRLNRIYCEAMKKPKHGTQANIFHNIHSIVNTN
uniref:Uncharacterized protein n=1 Tax=Arundo donax TaxID=35708 RepID=A0A0A9A446_ARUDO